MSAGAGTSVVLVEPSTLTRDLLRRGFQATTVRVAAESARADSTVDLCATSDADVLLISSQACTEEVLTTFPAILEGGTRILALCPHGDTGLVGPILLAGASGYLSQTDATIGEVTRAVETVARGEVMLHPMAAAAVLRQWRAAREGAAQDDADTRRERTLTARERDILAAMGSGLTTRAIGARLGMAAKTVETHKSHIFAKLGARNQAHAVAIAVERGLLTTEEQ